MSQLQIDDVKIEFPFEPYPLQKQYMNQVIQCLKRKHNGLLESPTGTGKTLSLLCSSLAWLNQQRRIVNDIIEDDPYDSQDEGVKIHKRSPLKGSPKERTFQESAQSDEKVQLPSKGPRIYFSSRTHSQLSQSMNEMKKSAYNRNKAVVLGSRDQLCIHHEVSQLETSAKNQACKAKIKSTGEGGCSYYQNYENKLQAGAYQDSSILDIEDLVSLGRKHHCCPYFASRKLQERSDIVFLPYNYLLDPQIRKFQGVELNNSVVIFDEGHNLEKVCEDAISVDIRSDEVAQVIRELEKLFDFVKKFELGEIFDSKASEFLSQITTDDIVELKRIMLAFEAEEDKEVKSTKNLETIHNDNWIFNVLSTIGLHMNNYQRHLSTIDKIISLLQLSAAEVSGSTSSLAPNAFEKVQTLIGLLFPEKIDCSYDTFQSNFKLRFKTCTIIDGDQMDNRQQLSKDWTSARDPAKVKKWTLNIWCLTPSIGIQSLLDTKVRNIIVTSGTLAPLDSFEAEFGVLFPVRLENPHIIQPTQMSIFPVSHGFDKVELNSKFNNKDNNKYYESLGNVVVDICNTVPRGVLLFFSSYAVLSNCIRRWKDNAAWGIWSKLISLKHVFEEPKKRDEFARTIEEFRNKVDESSSSGAIFMGVCRGKLSEGIDLSDHYCRAVIMIGLPFPATKDPRVILKKQYIDKMRYKGFNSSDWYMLQMKRALNQAVGRAIRNKNDYGLVFLLDYRFQEQLKDLSKWCQTFVARKTYRDIFGLEGSVRTFFLFNDISRASRQQPVQTASKVVDRKERQKASVNRIINPTDGENDQLIFEYTKSMNDNQLSKSKPNQHKSTFAQGGNIRNYFGPKLNSSGNLSESSSLLDVLYQQPSSSRDQATIEQNLFVLPIRNSLKKPASQEKNGFKGGEKVKRQKVENCITID